MIKRLSIVAATALALPASALGATRGQGVVLSVNAHRHVLEVVDTRHNVHAFAYRGPVRNLRPGAQIRFRRVGRRLTCVWAGAVGSVTFYARVVHSARGTLVLRLADHRTLRLPAGGSRPVAARNRTGKLAPLAHLAVDVARPTTVMTFELPVVRAGTTVAVTEVGEGHGRLAITVSLPAGYQLSLPASRRVALHHPAALPHPVTTLASAAPSATLAP